MPEKIVYEMGYGAGEFGNVLCGSFSDSKSSFTSEVLASNHWKVSHKETSFYLEIKVSEQPDRELGMFRLPVLKVCFQIQHDPGDIRAEFFKRFHQYFPKGVG